MSSQSPYKLHYWPQIPGRGEYVRLAFEAVGQSYTEENDVKTLMSHLSNVDVTGHPPHFAPPILEVVSSSPGSKTRKTEAKQSAKEGKASSMYLSQTPAILAYLGPKLGLVGDLKEDEEEEREQRRALVNQLTLTALDLSNEAHDSHHPIAVSLYYEDQKPEALRRSEDFRQNRVPKFFGYFENMINSNDGKSGRLVGETTTTADLVLFQVIDGLQFAFPTYMTSLQKSGKFPSIFALKQQIADEEHIKAYLDSERRKEYSMGLYRRYEELDGEFKE